MIDQKEEQYKAVLKKAYAEIRQLRQQLGNAGRREAVVVIGMSCRYPGASSPDQFWDFMKNRQELVREVPDDRWEVRRYFDPDYRTPGKIMTKYGSFLDDLDLFDAAFFEISPKEAKSLDPQQRMLLECSWQALENSGLNPAQLRGSSTGIFIGISGSEYQRVMIQSMDEKELDGYYGTGTMANTACGRLSFFYDFRGPCLAVDTACSSSLVALHLAAESIQAGECETALVGGVQALITPDTFIALSKMDVLSPDGRCKAFGDQADGFGRGEGCGFVVLKSLSAARRDGDNIIAELYGSSVRHDGRASGLTVPNELAQAEVISKSLKDSGFSVNDLDYIEAHGTGTNLGDPIEIQALTRVFKNRERKLWLGSVKSNIGHLESGAGIAGVIKVLLSLQNRALPPSLHCAVKNRNIQWDKVPFQLVEELTPWEIKDRPRVAGVSSFGIGGTLAHTILGDPAQAGDTVETKSVPSGVQVLTLSAKRHEDLEALVDEFQSFLKRTEYSLAEVCYTSNLSRVSLAERVAFVADGKQEMLKKLECFQLADRDQQRPARTKIAFLFTGQGSQYPEMGKFLFKRFSVFREAFLECSDLFKSYLGESIVDLLYNNPVGEDILKRTSYAQPVIFTVQYALVKLWESLRITPGAVLGHSIGEYAAAWRAGVFTLDEAVKLVAARGRALESAPAGGGMGVLFADGKTVRRLISARDIEIAGINSPTKFTVSGRLDDLRVIEEKARAEGIVFRELKVSHAFHSRHMEQAALEFKSTLETVALKKPRLVIVNDRTGKIDDGHTIADAENWLRHIREPILFAASLKALAEAGYTHFIELGGTPTLTGLGRETLPEKLFVASLSPDEPERKFMDALAVLFKNRLDVNWKNLYKDGTVQKIILPNYPFRRISYWIKDSAVRKDLIYDLNWLPGEKLEDFSRGNLNGHFIIFADRGGMSSDLEQKITAAGGKCTLIYDKSFPAPGNTTGHDSESLSINGNDFDEYKAILNSLGPDKLKDGRIIYLWHLDRLGEDPLDPSALELFQEFNLSSILNILHAMLLFEAALNCRLWIITRDTHNPGSESSLLQAALWGLGREIGIEHPDYWGGLIDLDSTARAENSAEVCLNEILAGVEEQSGYQGTTRYVPRIELRRKSVASPSKVEISPRGTYIVTGGFGEIGKIITRWLLGKSAGGIVLLGRRVLRGAEKEILADWNASGQKVVYYQCDVTDAQALGQVFRAESLRLLPVRGIFHAAGIVRHCRMKELSWRELHEVMQAKVRGAINLYNAIKLNEMDFVVYFSSASSVMGLSGEAGYVAANTFLNYFADYCNQRGLPSFSLNWGPWDQVEKGIATELGAERINEIGVFRLKEQTALKMMEECFKAMPSPSYILDIDWSEYSQYIPAHQRRGIFSGVCPRLESHICSIADVLKDLAAESRKACLIEELRKLCMEVMGFSDQENLSVDVPLMEQGLDSIMAVELKNRIEKNLGLEIYTADFFNYPDLDKMAEYLLSGLEFHEPAEQNQDADLKDFYELMNSLDGN